MNYQEYKSRKDKLDNAIIQWMTKKQPHSIQVEKVIRRATVVKGKWWNQIENDAAVLIANKFVESYTGLSK